MDLNQFTVAFYTQCKLLICHRIRHFESVQE